MRDKKHIDRLFQEKFRNFEVTPNEAVWGEIEQRLHKKRKKRRVLVWWQRGGVAAALLLAFTVGKLVVTSIVKTPKATDFENEPVCQHPHQTPLLESNKTTTPSINSNAVSDDVATISKEKEPYISRDISKRGKTYNSSSKKRTNTLPVITAASQKQGSSSNRASDASSNKNTITKLLHHSTQENATQAINKYKTLTASDRPLPQTTDSVSVITSIAENTDTHFTETIENDSTNVFIASFKAITEEKGIEDAIAEANNNKTTTETHTQKHQRWSISPNVAPVYFNSLGGGSSIDEQFSNNTTSNALSMSYGIKGSYALSHRLRVSMGVHRVSLNNIVDGVAVGTEEAFLFSEDGSNGAVNISMSPSSGVAMVMSNARSVTPSAFSPILMTEDQTGYMEQRFGFIEIPIEVAYEIIDKKLGLYLLGGFSTLFLNENDIFTNIAGELTHIGEANNMNRTSFSANFGLGIDYDILEHITINLEPKFKYQINTFTNTFGNFQPFFIGVYTGLTFKL